jgi:hypothetical protein
MKREWKIERHYEYLIRHYGEKAIAYSQIFIGIPLQYGGVCFKIVDIVRYPHELPKETFGSSAEYLFNHEEAELRHALDVMYAASEED